LKIQGAFAAKAVMGLFAIAAPDPMATNETVVAAMGNSLRVVLTIRYQTTSRCRV
jgi:hypothetical protein